MTTMIKNLLFTLLCLLIIPAQAVEDNDMDGVPNAIDKCANTPFLAEVNAQGCATLSLVFPQEKASDSLDMSMSVGFSNNEDLMDRDTQYTSKLQANYYLNDWRYSLGVEYFGTDDISGFQDTILKVKRKFQVRKNLKISFGLGIKLPSYDFLGNKTDYALYTSVIYYPKSALSLFGGASYTFINDEKSIGGALQNISTFYVGTGYFFNKDFYANIAYSNAQSKFVSNHNAQAINSTLFYKINKKWVSTLSYSHEIEDDDLHNALNFTLIYSVW